METQPLHISGIPSILWGGPSDKLYVYIHGMGGRKEEAETFAGLAVNRGWQVLSIDLPEHGERQAGTGAFYPWHAVPELHQVMAYAKSNWRRVALFANSIGAWFSMLSFAGEPLEQCLFVSPILDMPALILNMMRHAGVTEERLENEKVIPTGSGQPLSWEYLTYAREHPLTIWNPPTKILYAGHDNLTDRQTVDDFVSHFGCMLTVMDDGEHWFHTPEQMDVLNKWMEESLAENIN
jgi:alpha-beta hydrolase superfamily lysophospholipase